MEALITGLTGFVGGFLAEHLLACGDQVMGCSNRGQWPPPGNWPGQTLDLLGPQVPLFAWDVGSQQGLAAEDRARIAQFAPDCIYHLAAISVPEVCRNDPQRAETVNVAGTGRVFDLAASLSPRPRVLFVSSSHVYAPVTAESAPLDEDAPLAPRPGYGATKLAAEALAKTAHSERNLHVIVARAFQHTGPRQEPCMMLPEWAAQFARPGTDPIRVHNRQAWIDLTDVRDVVRAYRLLVEKATGGSTYNIGSGVPRRSGDVLDMLAARAGGGREVIELKPVVKHDPIADTRRLASLTGWRTEVPLEKTVSDTLDYWRQRTIE